MKLKNKIGILLDTLGMSQCIMTMNLEFREALKNSPSFSPALFYKTPSPTPYTLCYPVFHYAELYGFAGTLVGTSFKDLEFMNNVFGPKAKVLYLWDLDWNSPPNYELYTRILPSLDWVFLRSETHRNLFCNTWNYSVEKTSLVEDWRGICQ